MTGHAEGRELDALVAETIFGAVVNRAERGPWRLHAKDGTPEHIGSIYGTPWYYGAVPEFSTDVTAAFLALDQVGGRVKLERGLNEWFATIGSETHWGETLPLAICAALLASVAAKSTAVAPEEHDTP